MCLSGFAASLSRTGLKGLFFILLSVSVLCLPSCDSLSGDEPAQGCNVVFSVRSRGTRASLTSHEADLRSLEILAFDGATGALAGSRRNTGKDSVVVSLPQGSELVYRMVANVGADVFASAVNDAHFRITDILLSYGTENSIPMYGSGTVSVPSSTVPVTADRYFCKVSLVELAFAWQDALASGSTVRLGRIALVNASGSVKADGTPVSDPVAWYNRGSVEEAPSGIPSDYLVQEVGVFVDNGNPMTLNRSLYCCPNPVANAVDSSNDGGVWSPRPTRMSLEILVDGVSNWYPVTLPAMECNRHYVVSRLTVTGPGSESPDVPVTRDGVSFNVSVEPWMEDSLNAQFIVED